MLHGQVTIIGPKQRYIYLTRRQGTRAECQSSLYGLWLAFTSTFDATQVGRTTQTVLKSVATYF